MAGRRLRESVKETLIRNSKGEFNEETHVVIAGLTNTYSQYIATFEEYKQQRYEVHTQLIRKTHVFSGVYFHLDFSIHNGICRLLRLSMVLTHYQHTSKNLRN